MLPRPKEAFHGLAGGLGHDQVGVHESSIKISAEVNCVRCADILDDGIEHIKGWEFEFRACLQTSVAISKKGSMRVVMVSESRYES